MSHGVFLHRRDSPYDDDPTTRYQFPPKYLRAAAEVAGEWIVYKEPEKVPASRGYWAVARVELIVPDPSVADRHLALIAPGDFVEFPTPVPLRDGDGQLLERGLNNGVGKVSGRRQSAIRTLSGADFRRIVEWGLGGEPSLPRRDAGPDAIDSVLREEPMGFEVERPHAVDLTSRAIRDPAFRRAVLAAYGERCAVTGLRLINGGGRAEAEAAHIRPVAAAGPDAVANGLALSGTVHWMFDRGVIGLAEDGRVLISRQSNDPAGVRALVNRTGHALLPDRPADRPHRVFLDWHREHVFKH